MIVLTDYAENKLYQNARHYPGLRTSYGAPPIFYWFCNVKTAIKGLDKDSRIRVGEQSQPMEKQLGEVYFTCERVGNERVIAITDFDFNLATIRSYVSCRGVPSTPKPPTKPQAINSISYVKPLHYATLQNGMKVYAVQSDTHLYSLADKGKNLVINKWFNYLNFPLDDMVVGLHIIGYGSIDGIPYYIDDNLKMHHGAEIAIRKRAKRFESRNYRNNVIRLTESDLKRIIIETLTEILIESA